MKLALAEIAAGEFAFLRLVLRALACFNTDHL
jgi:hypothetical protein